MGVIGQNYLTLQYPVTQTTGVGFVRSALDRQKIVDYAEKLAIQSFNYAQSTNDVNISTGEARLITDEVARQKILRDLRSIAFSTQWSSLNHSNHHSNNILIITHTTILIITHTTILIIANNHS